MILQVINSGSKGNSYLLKDEKQNILLVECGVNIKKIKKALNFDLSKLQCALYTHEHMDHSVSVPDLIKMGVNVYASKGSHKAKKILNSHRAKVMKEKKIYKEGPFSFLGFKTVHDCEEPFGFIIKHEEMGVCLFLTDTMYSGFKFANLNQIIVEANYDEDIVNKYLNSGDINTALRNRVLQSHMSLQTLSKMLKANNLSKVNNIVLCHLSDSNSNESEFKTKIENQTGKTVHIAETGLTIENFNIRPF